MNYTKGEWKADNGESELWGIFQKEDCQGIAYLCEPDGKLLRPEEAGANANLIAAAPDMYEALKAQHEAIDILFAMLIQHADAFFPSKSGKPWEAMLQGNQALAKAEGKEEK